MGKKKLLAILHDFFDMELHARQKKKADLKKVLQKLKAKELELIDKCSREAAPEEKEKQKQKIKIFHAQRKKGISLLKELK